MRLDLSTRRPSAPTEELQEGGAGHDETLIRTGKSVTAAMLTLSKLFAFQMLSWL